jgi:hypothetical protein
VACTSSDAIGQARRCSDATSWTESSGVDAELDRVLQRPGDVGFSSGALGLGRGHGTLGLARAGQGAHGVARSVMCRVVCSTRGKDMCISQNASAVLGVQSMHGHWQGVGWSRVHGW